MRVTSAFSRLLDLPGVWVRSVSFEPDRVLVTVALRRRRLRCPRCSYCTRHRENRQHHDSVWRHLDLGGSRCFLEASLRRVRCPDCGVRVEAVPFARAGARHTRAFEQLVGWLAQQLAKNNIRVNSVAPGSILFPGGSWDKRQQADPAGIAEFVRVELPFGRFGRADEVGAAVAFLASPRASWISGSSLPVDGCQSRSLI